ncbi:MAG: O-antigen ligase family protein [Candidatus Nomurabacteria bacterium]|nr:O-antigen ligase family protein [Candidatus Nomurabacteria bacterium]
MKFFKFITLVNIVYFLLGFILFLVPLFFAPSLLSPFVEPRTFLFLAGVEIATFFYIWLVITNPEYRPKKSYIIYAFLSFVLINILSTIFGVDPASSFWSNPSRFDGLLVLAHLFLFCLIVVSTVKSKKVLHSLLWSSVSSAFVVTLSVFAVYFNYLSSSYFQLKLNAGASGGLIGNDSYTGVYLMFNIFLILYLIVNTENKIKRYVLESFLVIVLLSPVFLNFDIFKGKLSLGDVLQNPMNILGYARAPGLALVLSVLFMAVLVFLKHRIKKVRVVARTAIVLFLSSMILFSVLIFIPHTKANTWFAEQTGGNRMIFWHQAVEGFKDRPILGWGPGNFSYINDKYFDPSFYGNDYNASDNTSDRAHNIVFDTLATTGLLGLISYLSIYLFSLLTLWKSANISHGNKSIITGLLLAYILQNLVFFDVLVSYLLFVFVLAVIVVLNSTSSLIENVEPEEGQAFSKRILLMLSGLLIVTIFSIRYFIFLPLKESYLSFRVYELAPEMRGFHKGETDFSRFGTSRMAESHSFGVINWYSQNLPLVIGSKNKEAYIKDIEYVILDILKNSKQRGVSFWGADSIFRLYDIEYKLSKDPSLFSKMQYYSELEMVLVPRSVRGYINNAQVLFYGGKYKESLNVLEKAVVFSPANPVLHALIIDISKTIGDKKLIEDKIKRAEIQVPNFTFR